MVSGADLFQEYQQTGARSLSIAPTLSPTQ